MIDLAGNEIDPMTKKILKKNEPDFVPPVLKAEPKPSALGDRISQMINEKINKIVEEKIDEVLRNL